MPRYPDTGDFSQSQQLEPAYTPAYTAWQASPSPDTAGKLLEAVDPVVKSALRVYGGKSASSPTLRIKARSLAVDAFHSYDPQRASLKTHLMSHLRRLQRVAGQEQQIIRLPEAVAMQRKAAEEAGLRLEDTLGRPPSDQELTDELGISPKRLAYIRQGARPYTSGQSPVENAQVDNTTHAAWLEFVHDSLAPRDQFILERVMGMHGQAPCSPSEVARHLKISTAAVSQRMKSIQEQLDSRDELKIL